MLRPRSPLRKKEQKVGFCLPAAETHSTTVESLPVPSAPQRIIECLCSTIRNTTEMCACVGVLVGNNSKHQVWAPRAPLATPARVVSLAELLSLPEPPKRERLKLGVKLASSVLQFHRTEWLQERWGKQDIYLVQGDICQSSSPSLKTPVVRQAFTPDPPVSEVSIESHVIRCNLSLFSLGIVLIELWFWKSVESFQPDGMQASCGAPWVTSDTARFLTAQRLIDKLYEDAGDNYGDIVRRCILGLDHKETRLENDGFKNEVYLKVLQPLAQYLGQFCDEPYEEIFERWGQESRIRLVEHLVLE